MNKLGRQPWNWCDRDAALSCLIVSISLRKRTHSLLADGCKYNTRWSGVNTQWKLITAEVSGPGKLYRGYSKELHKSTTHKRKTCILSGTFFKRLPHQHKYSTIYLFANINSRHAHRYIGIGTSPLQILYSPPAR